MKNLLLNLFVILIGIYSQAQNQFLEVAYQMEMKMDADRVISSVPPAIRPHVESSLREEIKKGIFIDYILQTNGTESEYKMVEKINNDQTPAGIILQQITAMDKEPLYKNIPERYYLKPIVAGKAFLMKDSLKNYKWKISKEKVQIAGFDAFKATGVLNDSVAVTAWYTPKLTMKDGPDRIWGLPGLILKTEFIMNGTDIIITAVKVDVKKEEIKINRPTKGQEISEEDFINEMKALEERMKEMMGGGVDTN